MNSREMQQKKDDAIDEEAGISREELQQLLIEQSDRGLPASAQQEVDDQARKWAEVWGSNDQDATLQWPVFHALRTSV